MKAIRCTRAHLQGKVAHLGQQDGHARNGGRNDDDGTPDQELGFGDQDATLTKTVAPKQAGQAGGKRASQRAHVGTESDRVGGST